MAAAIVLGLGAAGCTSNIPEADHAVPAPPGLVQFRGDFDTGDNSQWELETAKDYSLTVVDDGPGHPTAARFEVRDGDTPVDSGERSEVRAEDRNDPDVAFEEVTRDGQVVIPKTSPKRANMDYPGPTSSSDCIGTPRYRARWSSGSTM